jgi:RimJ/RimL family protein N-acetyltransferase
MQAEADYRHLRTERLRLDAITHAEMDAVHALHADPAVWQHFPSGLHDRERSRALVAQIERDWEKSGLGYWAISHAASDDDEPLLGVGGCARRRARFWNLYYRLNPAGWGQGFATEMIGAALSAAADVRPDLPVVAYLLEHNVASKRSAERAGLQLAWRGPDAGNPDPAAIRLVYADRPLPDDLVEILTTSP